MVIVVVVMGLIIFMPSPTPDYTQAYVAPAPVQKTTAKPVQKTLPTLEQKEKKTFVIKPTTKKPQTTERVQVKQETDIQTPSILPRGQKLALPKGSVTGPSAK